MNINNWKWINHDRLINNKDYNDGNVVEQKYYKLKGHGDAQTINQIKKRKIDLHVGPTQKYNLVFLPLHSHSSAWECKYYSMAYIMR